MKAIIQRVTAAKVTVNKEIVSCIGKGLCVFIGVSQSDTEKDVDFMVRKILALRIFENSTGKRWQKNVKDENYEILCISQFTLYNRLKGNKLDFHLAMQGSKAEHIYNDLLILLKLNYHENKIKDGKFGTYMQVHIQNDGPITLQLESPNMLPSTNYLETPNTEDSSNTSK